MKRVTKRLIRDEKGAALVLALILLLVGGLIVTPLLAHMGSGILAGEIYEKRTAELYAADAGVEDALWRLPDLGLCLYQSTNYTIADINGKTVQVFIEFPEPGIYRVTSIAITDSEGDGGIAAIDSTTAVEAYVSATYMDFSSFLDNAIVSDESITIKKGMHVTGNVTSGGTVTFPGGEPEDVDGTVTENATLTWPTYDQLSNYYLEDIEGTPDPGPSIDIKHMETLGPCDREGSLTVDNTGEPDTLVLEGTVYVRGDLTFEQPGASKHYTINLNGQTIFVEGAIDVKPGHISVIGSGCIIAVGDIFFAPMGDVGSENDFVLVMSIEGTTTLQPSGTFYGCVAGNLYVDVKSGHDATITHTDPEEGKGLNFPGVEGGDTLPPVTAVRIDSWEVIQQ